MKQKIIAVVILIFLYGSLFAQTIKGNLKQLAKQEIKLEGFNGLTSYTIAKTTSDDMGNFTLSYAKNDVGAGYLTSADNKPLVVILSGEDIELEGDALSDAETIQITKGQENKWFERYAKEHPRREQALSAWSYLEKLYRSDVLFAMQKVAAQAIQNEKQRINKEDAAFLASLPKGSYVSWFLTTKKLASAVSNVTQYQKDEIPVTLAAFRNFDYADPQLYRSGLLKDVLESHFWLIENSGKPLDSVHVEMQISIDAMLNNLVKDSKKLNEITNFLFNFFERHSLFEAAEYLAIQALNDGRCTLEDSLAKQLETYRVMKKGNTAPDIVFDQAFFSKPSQSFGKLADIINPYTLVVFGASWCPKCSKDISELTSFYDKWKARGVEVVFISLEEDRNSFIDFTANLPFHCYSDLKKWNSKIVTDYYVSGTPTMFLLNNKRKIILRPISVKQVDAWVNTYIN